MRHLKIGLILAAAAVFTTLLTAAVRAEFKPEDVIAITFACKTEAAARAIAVADMTSPGAANNEVMRQAAAQQCAFTPGRVALPMMLKIRVLTYEDANGVFSEIWRVETDNAEHPLFVIVADLRKPTSV